MFENIDEEYRLSLISCIECLKDYQVTYLTSSVLILSFIHFEDSLLNELYPNVSFNEVLNFLIDNKETKENCFNEDLEEVLNLAEEIARSNGSNVIYDEYILYACLKKNCSASNLLYELGSNIEELRKEVINYLNDDNTFLTNLTKLAMENKLDPFIGRTYYITKMIRILSKKQKNNCLLIGNAGVGKSAIVEGLAIELFKRKSSLVIYRLDLGVVIAGTRYRGDLEERLVEVINSIKESNAVLFIDEVHSIVSSGNSEGSLDIANILKPALARSEIKCIGATTIDEYYKYIEKDKALDRRFEKIFIPEASKEETFNILKGISSRYEEYYKIKYKNKILREIVESCKFFPNRKFPDKAIDILDEVSAYANECGRNYIKNSDLRKIVLENIGLIKEEKKNRKLHFEELKKYYDLFFLGLDARETIMNVIIKHQDLDYLLKDLENVFMLSSENVLNVDFYLDGAYKFIEEHINKYPISVLVIKFEKIILEEFINKYIYGNLNRKLSFKNTIIIFDYNSENDVNIKPIGYSFGDQYLKNKPKYIDEIIVRSSVNNLKIKKLVRDLRNNNYDVRYSKNLNDTDYFKVLERITENISNRKIKIHKDNEGKITIK